MEASIVFSLSSKVLCDLQPLCVVVFFCICVVYVQSNWWIHLLICFSGLFSVNMTHALSTWRSYSSSSCVFLNLHPFLKLQCTQPSQPPLKIKFRWKLNKGRFFKNKIKIKATGCLQAGYHTYCHTYNLIFCELTTGHTYFFS